MSFHELLIEGDIHVPYQWKYANATTREAATGFVSGDLNKLALQEDDNSLWQLVDISPIDWRHIGSQGSKLVKSFVFGDVAGGSLSIGKIEGGQVVGATAIVITQAFNNSTTITVGDAAAQGRLMVVADNDPTAINNYKADNDLQYASDTDTLIYFPSGTPTQGAGLVILYLA